MLFKEPLDRDSDAKVAVSDPFSVNGEALYLPRENGHLAVPVTSMNVNNPAVKLGSNVQAKKKTFQAANKYRESVAQAAMAPPPGGKMQHIKPTPNVTSSRAIKASHLSMNVSRPVTGLSGNQSAVPFAPSHVALTTKVPSIQGTLESRNALKRPAPQDVDDDTLCNEPLAQRTRSDTVPAQIPKSLNGVQADSNGNFGEDSKNGRPQKRRRVLNEQGGNAPVQQETENKAISTSSVPPETSQHNSDKILPSNYTVAESSNPPEESSAAIRPRPTSAFQKYAMEHSLILQARKAHWSTCSMETWLAGGQEIADRFAQLLGRSVSMFETDVSAFESVDQTFDGYKKEVLDNRDQVLRKAKDTIIFASSTLVGGEPSRAEPAY